MMPANVCLEWAVMMILRCRINTFNGGKLSWRQLAVWSEWSMRTGRRLLVIVQTRKTKTVALRGTKSATERKWESMTVRLASLVCIRIPQIEAASIIMTDKRVLVRNALNWVTNVQTDVCLQEEESSVGNRKVSLSGRDSMTFSLTLTTPMVWNKRNSRLNSNPSYVNVDLTWGDLFYCGREMEWAWTLTREVCYITERGDGRVSSYEEGGGNKWSALVRVQMCTHGSWVSREAFGPSANVIGC